MRWSKIINMYGFHNFHHFTTSLIHRSASAGAKSRACRSTTPSATRPAKAKMVSIWALQVFHCLNQLVGVVLDTEKWLPSKFGIHWPFLVFRNNRQRCCAQHPSLVHCNATGGLTPTAVYKVRVPVPWPCVTKENIRYRVADGATNLNPGSKGPKITPSKEECRQWCKNEFPGQAEFFTWNKDVDMFPQSWRKACFCKKNAAGKIEHEGSISGNVDCE